MDLRLIRLDIYRTLIPMRKFEHAAAARDAAEAVVVRLEGADGQVGWGETLPRAYVTGETIDSVIADLRDILWPALLGVAGVLCSTGVSPVAGLADGQDCRRDAENAEKAEGPRSKKDTKAFSSSSLRALRASAARIAGESPATLTGETPVLQLPSRSPDGRCINAALCALDLALLPWTLEAISAVWHRFPTCAVQAGGHRLKTCATRRWLAGGVSGVLGCSDLARTLRQLRLMRWFGLVDFKLKLGLGDDVDAGNLEVVAGAIGKPVAGGKCTLRVDVNGAWTPGEAPTRIERLVPYGVCAVEQPAFCPAGELVELARRCPLPLIADESLLTVEDAQVLLAEPERVWWNIRLSKNGGLTAALALACLAARHGVTFVAGCMVGESGILSAAQRRLLELGPPPRFVEGNYGRFLLADDLIRRSLRFGYGGRLKRLSGSGSGVEVDPRRLAKYGRLAATLRR